MATTIVIVIINSVSRDEEEEKKSPQSSRAGLLLIRLLNCRDCGQRPSPKRTHGRGTRQGEDQRQKSNSTKQLPPHSLVAISNSSLLSPPPFHFCSKHSTGSKTPRLTIYFGTMKLSSASRRVARLMCFQRMLFLAWLICRFKQNRKDQNGRRNKKKNTAETKQMHNSSSVWPLVFQL